MRYRAANPEKLRADDARYAAANPEKRRAASAKWACENPAFYALYARTKRARKLSAPGDGVTPDQWQRILDESLGLCMYCGQGAVLTMDHIDPLIRGGAHDVGNVAAVCKPCNSRKNDTPLLIWMAKRANQRALASAIRTGG